MRAKWFNRRAALVLLLGLLLPAASTATAVTYTFSSGDVDVTGTVGGSTLFSHTGIPLTGNFIIFDDMAPSIDGIDITGGPSALITLSSPYGGADAFTLDSFSIVPNAGFTQTVAGGPTSFTFSAGPLDVSGSATSYSGGSPIGTIPFSTTTIAPITGTFDLTTGALTLTGVTFVLIDASLAPGETEDLIVKADITFFGVPEPSMALLLTVGMACAVRRRRIFS